MLPSQLEESENQDGLQSDFFTPASSSCRDGISTGSLGFSGGQEALVVPATPDLIGSQPSSCGFSEGEHQNKVLKFCIDVLENLSEMIIE